MEKDRAGFQESWRFVDDNAQKFKIAMQIKVTHTCPPVIYRL